MGVRLPAEYQEVEYIQSVKNDQQWIDTGIPITYSLVMEITFAIVSVVGSYYVMGEYANNNGAFYLYTSSKFQTAYGCSYANTTVNADTEKHTFRYSFDNANTIVSENGQQILSKSKISPLATSNSIIIAGSKIRNQLSCKTYSFVAYDNGVKVADFIPCYRKSDDKPGMYDLVTETFLVNQGTGEDFTVGHDVIDSISPWLMARRRALMARDPFYCPYVKDGLIFWLDGIRKGDDPTVWEDLVSGIAFDMSGVTFTTNGVEFVAGSYGAYAGNIAVPWDVGTIEACVDYAPYQSTILSQKTYSPTPLSLIMGSGANVGYAQDGQNRPRGSATYGWKTISVNADLVVRNGTSVGFGVNDTWSANPDDYTYLGIKKSNYSTYRFAGTMYSIRIYNRKLTEQEMIFNQSVDDSRFNLGLNI